MEILNRSLRAIRGMSDDPLVHPYQQEALDMSNEDKEGDESPRTSQQTRNPDALSENPAEDIVIDFEQADGEPPQEDQPVPETERMNENITEEFEPVDPNYTRAIENIIKIGLYTVLKWNTVGGFLLILLIFTLKWGLSFLYILLLICLVDIYSLLSVFQNQVPADSVEKRRHALQLIQNFLTVVAKISLVFYVYIKPFFLIYSFAPTLGFEFLYGLYLAIKYKSNSLRKFYFIQLMLKAFNLVFIGSIALKVDGLITWHWREVFTSFWVIYAIWVSITLIICLAFLNKFLSFFLPDRRVNEIYGLLWLVMLFSGTSVLACLLTLRLQKVLEHQLDPGSLFTLFMVIAAYNIGLVIFTTFHFTKIEEFFKTFAIVEEEEQEAEQANPEQEGQQQAPTKKLVIPRFLTRSSNTYFRRVTQNDIEKNKARQKKAKQKAAKVKPSSKPIKYTRKGSLDATNAKRITSEQGIVLNSELLTIPETDRDKLRTELTGRTTRRDFDMKPLNLHQKKVSEISNFGLTSLATDRSRGGLLASSHRSTVNFQSGDFSNTEEGGLPTARREEGGLPTARREEGLLPSARRGRDNDKLDSHRSPRENTLPQYLQIEEQGNEDNPEDEREENKAESGLPKVTEIEESPPVAATQRLVRSFAVLPSSYTYGNGLHDTSEISSYHNNSKLEASEMITSPTGGDVSGVQQCLICFDNPPDAVFMECGHGGVCYECSLEIWKTTAECYLCRKKITQVLQIDAKNKIGSNIMKVISATQMVLCGNETPERPVAAQ